MSLNRTTSRTTETQDRVSFVQLVVPWRPARFLVRILIALAAAFLIPACKRGGSGSVTAGPSLAALFRGGTGSTGSGGGGGSVQITGQTASDVSILREGSIDASFAVSIVKPVLGANPRTISINTSLQPTVGNQILGDDNLTAATGLWVRPGATLTLRPSLDTAGTAVTLEQATVIFTSGIYLEGTIRAGRKDAVTSGDGATLNGADLLLTCNNFVSRSTGSVDTSGDDSAGAAGSGGFFNVTSTLSIVNAAAIDSTGGAGATGGNGGGALLQSASFGAYNTGAITTSGGAATAGSGGSAGLILVAGSAGGPNSYGGGFNSGALTAKGGSGTTFGGAGNLIQITGAVQGAAANTGNLDTSGGDASAGTGGGAGLIFIIAAGASLRTSGSLTGNGGAGTVGGGNASIIFLQATYTDAIFFGGIGGGIFCSGSISGNGGNGGNGGTAGAFIVSAACTGFINPGTNPIVLAGYSRFDCTGGDGVTSGAGVPTPSFLSNLQANDGTDTDGDGTPGPGLMYVGSIETQADWILKGGAATAGNGGTGGNLTIQTQPPAGGFENSTVIPNFDRSLRNSGAINLAGGAGTTTGGDGGALFMFEQYTLSSSGSITTSGGNGGTGAGGAGGAIELISNDVCSNTGPLAQNGGASASGMGGTPAVFVFGGQTYSLLVIGRTTTCTGGATANGGDTGSGPAGGAGGIINIVGTENSPSVSGTFSVKGGTSVIPGATGTVTINGVNLFLTNGAVSF